MLLSAPASTSSKLGNVTNYLFNTDFGAFVQDDFTIFPNLTMNLGLRYEIRTPPYQKYGQLTNHAPAIAQVVVAGYAALPNLASIVAWAGLTNYMTLSSTVGLPFSTVYANYKDFAPRLGLAWRPFGNNKTVVRTG
jgi:outer membrane receptor protein involved in Fe transport